MNDSELLQSESVSLWITQLKQGDSLAVDKLWGRYFHKLVELARDRLEGSPRAAADEEDVALSAFHSLCMGARFDQFPRLTDRTSLWALLIAITAHKCVDQIRFENRKKRRPAAHSTGACTIPAHADPISQIISTLPTPEFEVLASEQFDLFMVLLDQAQDPDLRQIALATMLGDSTGEIADKFGCGRRTIQRKLALIRRLWEQECQ